MKRIQSIRIAKDPYFNPASGTDPESAYQRSEGFNNGEWSYLIVRAVATVETSADGQTWLINYIASGGMLAETDSDEEFIKYIADEGLSELQAALEEFGFSADEIACITPA